MFLASLQLIYHFLSLSYTKSLSNMSTYSHIIHRSSILYSEYSSLVYQLSQGASEQELPEYSSHLYKHSLMVTVAGLKSGIYNGPGFEPASGHLVFCVLSASETELLLV